MATPDSAMAKYADKTRPGGIGEAKWNAAKANAPARWAEGLRRFGITPGPLSSRAYSEGLARAAYRGGDPAYWLRRFQEGLSK